MARIKRRTIANNNIKAPEVKINSADKMMNIPDHVVKKDASTRTYDYNFSSRINIILKYLPFGIVANLFSILTYSLNDWKSIHLRILIVSVYLILRLLNISFASSRDSLTSLRMLNIQICHAWATKTIDEGNLCVILRDDRGSYKRIPCIIVWNSPMKLQILDGFSQNNPLFLIKDVGKA
ncbi:unnamed protein product [Brachionus calyciflorus]|uniref:Uncharacterized protein n=1 Tax=Brachionus calyciflorus TaxID=104777 RepID=A0A814JDR6_9BILA|nr:unnamed protein product [Brachionus calyciflorus]